MIASLLPGQSASGHFLKRLEAYYCFCYKWYRRPRLWFCSWWKRGEASNTGFEGIPSRYPQYPGRKHCLEVGGVVDVAIEVEALKVHAI